MQNLESLKLIANILRDRDLEKMSSAQKERATTEALLNELNKNSSIIYECKIFEAQLTELHNLWMLQRRGLLNRKLAHDTALFFIARDQARKSFGRSEVIDKLSRD